MGRVMKDSGNKWIGTIPQEWDTVKNKYLLKDMYSGGTPASSDEKMYDEKGVPFISIGDMSSTEYLYDAKKKVSNAGIADKNLRILDPGTVLYSIYATIGSVAELAIKATISQAILALQLKEGYNKTYYKYNLKAMKDYICQNANGNTQFNLNAEKVWNFTFVRPSFKEQQYISDFLDKKCAEIDSVIEKTEKTIEEYKALKQSIITEAVTKGIRGDRPMKDSGVEWIEKIPQEWENKPLKACFSFGNGLPITKENLIDDGVPVISYGQIHAKWNSGVTMHPQLFRFVSDSYLKSNPSSLVSKGDFIFADTSEDLDGCGNCTYVDREETVFAGYHTIILKSLYGLNNKYFAYLFKTNAWRSQIRIRTMGVKLFSTTKRILSKTTLIIPNKEEQNQIIDFLDEKCAEIDKLINSKQQLLSELDLFRKSLIYEYVTGKKEVPACQ